MLSEEHVNGWCELIKNDVKSTIFVATSCEREWNLFPCVSMHYTTISSSETLENYRKC